LSLCHEAGLIMWGTILLCGSAFAVTSVLMAQRPDAIAEAARSLGAADIRTLQFSGSGATFTVGQNFAPGDPWPRVAVRNYTARVDFDNAGLELDFVREMGAVMPRGGGVPFTGDVRQIQAVSGAVAWNVPMPANPAAGSLPVMPCTPPEAGGTPPQAAPAPNSRTGCRLMIWTFPQGFVKAAIANHATVATVPGGTEVSFVIVGRFRMTGLINAQHDVERVRTWISQSIVGDMLVETAFSGYRDFNGVRFPSRIVQTTDGFPSLDLAVGTVTANAPIDIAPPPELRDAPEATPAVHAQMVAEGVFWLTGATHHSLAVAMRDHIVLVDTPNGEPRALAVIAKARELIPAKPIRYVIAMHHHWDHMGGIRTAIAEGATIVTHESNRALLERAATSPHTINPDRLATSKKRLVLQTVGTEGTLTDGTRTIKLYAMTGFDHSADMLLVYLPKERLLAEADAYTPNATPATPLIATKVPYAAALYATLQRLKLDVATIVPFHGSRIVELPELARQAGAG
jgi:glyoxylase-like metal-dependent hydrolase (beta-lactamase superfamily II)